MAVRGILNVAGVSCHLSCALQILCHIVAPLREALIYLHKVSSSHNTKNHLSELGNFFESLILENDNPVDPTHVYKILEKLASIDSNDVGDSSTAICKLLEVIRTCAEESADEWTTLLEACAFGGKTRQAIAGRKREGDKILVRTKKGKLKSMAYPFPLVGSFYSVEDALKRTLRPEPVGSYDWDRSEQVFEEERLEDDSVLELSDKWITHKTLLVEELPANWFLHLERFSYHDGIKTLSNPKVSIPSKLHLAQYCKMSGTYNLLGGILHVTEDSIEEEGHYVAVVRDSAESWVLIDDEECTRLSQENVLEFLSGGKNEKGCFLCATLLAYSKEDSDKEEEARILTDLKKRISETVSEPAHERTNPEEIVGRRLRVRWAKGKLYRAIVTSYDNSTGKHRVQYDDGDVKDYILAKKTIEWDS